MKKKEVTNADLAKAIARLATKDEVASLAKTMTGLATKGELAKAVLATKADIEKAVEVLAIGTAKGFAAMDQRFEGLEKGLNRHEGILHTMNRRIEGVEEDVRSVKNSLSLVLALHD